MAAYLSSSDALDPSLTVIKPDASAPINEASHNSLTRDVTESDSANRGIFLNWNNGNSSQSYMTVSPPSSESTSDSGQVFDMSPSSPDDLQYNDLIEGRNASAVSCLANSSCVYQMPIVGYEVQEEHNRFTIFKIQVVHIPTTSKWYVFRRYTDFVRLNKKLKSEFPGLRFALPPKRWFGNNFDPIFLEDRQLGLQAFINNIIAHNKICSSKSVRSFFCLDNPPSPHESLEESMALCHCLEQAVTELQERLHTRDSEVGILKSRIDLLLTQQEALIKALRLESNLNKDGDSKREMHNSTHDLNLALLDICEETLKTQNSATPNDLSPVSNISDQKSLRRISLSFVRSPSSLPGGPKENE